MKREPKTLSYIARLCLEYEKTPDKYTDHKTSHHVTLKADWDYWRFENV